MSNNARVGQVARWFHEAYERLAPDYGYRTREESAKPWREVPAANRALMMATVGEVLDRIDDTTPDDLRQVRERAYVDGRLAAFADASDLTPLVASRTGLVDPAGELVGVARDLPDGTARDVVLRVAAGITGNDDEEGDRADQD